MKKVVRSEFGRNVLTLMTGSSLAQTLPILLIPVLTRLFSPEEFGLYALYMSMITFLLVISAGRYEQAIVLPRSNEDSINVLALAFKILLYFTGSMSVIILCFNKQITAALNKPDLNVWLWLLPICVFFASTYKILSFWNIRKKQFKKTSGSVIVHTSGRILTQTVGGGIKLAGSAQNQTFFESFKPALAKGYVVPEGISKIGIGSLILSYIIGFFLGTIFLLVPILKYDKNILSSISKSKMKEVSKTYEKFPKINSLHAMGDEFKNIGVNATISYVFSDVILGFYSMTFRVLRAPLTVIGNSFGQVFFQKAAEMHSDGKSIVVLIQSTVKKLALIALPIFIIILFLGPDLFAFVLGEKWRVSGEYTQYLTPWIFLNFIISPIQQVAIIMNKQGKIFLLSILGNALILFSILAGGFIFNNIKQGLLMLSIVQVFYYLYIYLWIKSLAVSHQSKQGI